MPTLFVNNLCVDYRLRRSLRVKHLQMVFKDNYFEVVAPRRLSNHAILAFVWEKRRWMTRVMHSPRSTPLHSSLTFYDNNTLWYRGHPRPVYWHQGNAVSIDCHPEGIVCTVPSLQNINKTKILFEWLQSQMQTINQSIIERVCPLLGVWPKKVLLKKQKSRWGSCGINDAIHINMQLVFAPEGVLEYVMVHELCHLIHRNHGKRFWQKVGRMMPEYHASQTWLRQHGQWLMRIQIPHFDTQESLRPHVEPL